MSTTNTKQIFIVSGGTGGHIIPAVCLARLLQQQGNNISFFGDNKISSYLNSRDTFFNKTISSAKITKSFLQLVVATCKIIYGILQCYYFIASKSPNVIIAFGGYASFPMLFAAVLAGKKIILHEQNAHLGKVNRLFARFAYKIATSFPNTSGLKEQQKACYVGNPIRPEIAMLYSKDYILPENELPNTAMGYPVLLNSDFYIRQEKIKILILGGSGGAKIFSDILPKAFFNLPDYLKKSICITQQCRKDLLDSTIEQYKSLNIDVVASSFFGDMQNILEQTHLVIARAGASSLFEFCAAKKPMILVPFALSADNHQQKNADYMAKNGAALVVQESDFTIKNISDILIDLLQNQQNLYQMSKNSANLAKIDATILLAKLID